MSLPRFFASDAREGVSRVTLMRDEAHHLAHVLRLAAGDAVRVFNGAGGEWSATVATVARRFVELALIEALPPVPEPPVRVTLAIGVLKGDQMDTVVRDATALGVSAVVPFTSTHVTVPSRAWASGAAVDRWRRIAIASAKQCGRAVVPTMAPVAPFAQLLDSNRDELLVMCVEPALADARASELPLNRPTSALALIGPEGGWSPDEVDAATAAGARFVHLGPRTLRAEIVPAVLLSSLWTTWGW
jgi:16S rRNA (uracil1498-N3)-methyltransferase